jgi:hypothetical protein
MIYYMKSRKLRRNKRTKKRYGKRTLKKGGGIKNINPELIKSYGNLYHFSDSVIHEVIKVNALKDDFLISLNEEIELQRFHDWLNGKINKKIQTKIENFFNTIPDLKENDILIISDDDDSNGLVFKIKKEKINDEKKNILKYIQKYKIPIDEQKQFLKFKESKQSFPYSFKTLQKHIEKELNLRMKNAQIYQIESIPLYHLLKDQKQLNEIKTYDKPINIKEFELQQLYDDVLDNTAMDKSIMSETDQNVLSNFFTTNEEKFKENDILIINKSLYYIIKIDDKNNISFILIIEKSNKVEQRKKMVELTKKLRENRKKYNIKTPGFTSLWDEEEKPMMKRSKTSQNLKKLT